MRRQAPKLLELWTQTLTNMLLSRLQKMQMESGYIVSSDISLEEGRGIERIILLFSFNVL